MIMTQPVGLTKDLKNYNNGIVPIAPSPPLGFSIQPAGLGVTGTF